MQQIIYVIKETREKKIVGFTNKQAFAFLRICIFMMNIRARYCTLRCRLLYFEVISIKLLPYSSIFDAVHAKRNWIGKITLEYKCTDLKYLIYTDVDCNCRTHAAEYHVCDIHIFNAEHSYMYNIKLREILKKLIHFHHYTFYEIRII